MSADILRRAADLMRERAKAARAGKWGTEPSALTPDATLVVAQWQNDLRRVATCSGSLPEGNAANAEHIASWRPTVALAVADWLDWVADGWSWNPQPIGNERKALDVARAYLNEGDAR